MENVQHTPGFWRSENYVIFDDAGGMIGQSFLLKAQDQGLNNARLMAAAPELLAALKFCLQQLRYAHQRDREDRAVMIALDMGLHAVRQATMPQATGPAPETAK